MPILVFSGGGDPHLPATGDVRSTAAPYGPDLDQQGTLVVPSAADVRFGTQVDAETGLLIVPQMGDVRNGVPFDAMGFAEGTLVVPSVDDVRNGIGFDELGSVTGNLVVPLAAQVKVGVAFDSSGSQTGTYAGEPLDLPQAVEASLAPVPQRLEVSVGNL